MSRGSSLSTWVARCGTPGGVSTWDTVAPCGLVQCTTCTMALRDLVAAGAGEQGWYHSKLLTFSLKFDFLIRNMVIPLPSSQSHLED